MARIDDLLSGWDDDEVDPEYVAQQRARRNAKRPKGTNAEPSPLRPSAEHLVQRELRPPLQKRPTTPVAQDKAIAQRLCKAQSQVRYPKDHPDESLRGQPVLDSDGARQYKPCERPPMHGQEVCQKHGGMAPQAIAAAKLRLQAATEPLIAALVRIAQDERLSPDTRIKYINSALDRAGIRAGMDVNVEAPGWQSILGKMFGDGSSAQDDPDRTIDAEVVESEPLDIAELNARIGERFEPDPTGLTPEQMANYTQSDETPPRTWGLPRNGRVRR